MMFKQILRDFKQILSRFKQFFTIFHLFSHLLTHFNSLGRLQAGILAVKEDLEAELAAHFKLLAYVESFVVFPRSKVRILTSAA